MKHPDDVMAAAFDLAQSCGWDVDSNDRPVMEFSDSKYHAFHEARARELRAKMAAARGEASPEQPRYFVEFGHIWRREGDGSRVVSLNLHQAVEDLNK